MTAKELGQMVNGLLREKKQIPHPTPRLVSPKVQGWLAGIVASNCDDMEESDKHAFTVECYTVAFDGVNMGQQFGLDMILSSKRILSEGPVNDYNIIFKEYYVIGKTEEASKESFFESTLATRLGG